MNDGVYVLFARGSGEKIGGPRAVAFKKALIGNESSVGQFQALGISTAWAELGNLDGLTPDGKNPTNPTAYPAVAAAQWVADPGYGSSVRIGTEELIKTLNQRYGNGPNDRNCSTETVVLGGYSQGADVIGWALQGGGLPEALSPAAKSHLGYIALYGDPRFNRGDGWDNCAANNNPPSWMKLRLACISPLSVALDYGATGLLYFAAQGILGPRQPYIPQEFVGRVGSWCDAADYVCASDPDYTVNLGTHTTAYDGHLIAQSALEIAHEVVPQLNSLIPYDQAYPVPPAPTSDFASWQQAQTLTPPPPPVVKFVKRTVDPNGVRQVYAATSSTITEGWWMPGGDGVHVHEMINISQNNIVGFDKVNLPDGTQSLYTAVPDGVWETYWNPTVGVHSAKIITGLSGVRQVIVNNVVQSGQYTHRLYVLASDGPHEYWWRDGGDGIHQSLLNSIVGAVTMVKSTAPDGVTDQLYVATPTWVYELWWNSGGMHTGTIINITQGDIRSLDKGDNLSDGGQLLYTGTSTTAWQSYWNSGGISNGTIATGQTNIIQVKKTVTNGVHQLYLATPGSVQEFWWNGPSSGNSTLINISQNNITAFDKDTDGAAQQLYTGAGDAVWETWWGGGQSPTSSVLFHVAR